ncbi:MAG: hypothetical protein AB7P14_17480 [Blastocatellales bacterium]
MIHQTGKVIVATLALAALCIYSATSLQAQNRRAPQHEDPSRASAGQRLAPPSAIKCSRDHLTSFTGRVLAYERSSSRIFIRVRTDEETTESFTLKLTRKDEAAEHFLMRGETFRQSDWKLVESAPGKLHQPMRATIWVCDDSPAPVIDWRPPEKN